MDWIVWDHSLETGNAKMDADHRELAGLFDQLREAAEGGGGSAACSRVLDNIVEHTKAHFALEQRLMTQYQYPKTEQHAAEHTMLIRQALEFRERFNRDFAASKAEVIQFPDVWLTFHILFSDKDLAAFLAGKQIRDS